MRKKATTAGHVGSAAQEIGASVAWHRSSELRTVIDEAGALVNGEGKQDAKQKLHLPGAKRHCVCGLNLS
jgi:hypothetical protein